MEMRNSSNLNKATQVSQTTKPAASRGGPRKPTVLFFPFFCPGNQRRRVLRAFPGVGGSPLSGGNGGSLQKRWPCVVCSSRQLRPDRAARDLTVSSTGAVADRSRRAPLGLRLARRLRERGELPHARSRWLRARRLFLRSVGRRRRARRGELAHTMILLFFLFRFSKKLFLNSFFLFFVKLSVPYCHSKFLNFFSIFF
jgi:hypothetical protein